MTTKQAVMRQKQSMEEIAQFTELPYDFVKETMEQLVKYPEWNNEQILENIRRNTVREEIL